MSAQDPSTEPLITAALDASAAVIAGLRQQAPAIASLARLFVATLRAGGKVLTAGNGGSAAEALHMSEELVGRFLGNRPSLPAVCLAADPTALTCIANDFGYDCVFSRQVEGLGRRGDLLVVFSTSGNAENLSRAIDAAKRLGVKTAALLGRDGGKLAGRADVELIVRSAETARIQEAHQVLLHLLLEHVEREFSPR